MLRVSRAALERMLAAHLARKPECPQQFEVAFDCQNHPIWGATMAYLVDLASRQIDFSDNALLAAQVEQLVVTTMLSTLTHNFTGASVGRAAWHCQGMSAK